MNALLDYDKTATVVVVDWKGGSSPPYYQAVANIRLIGSITAHIIYSIYVIINCLGNVFEVQMNNEL